MAGGCVESAVGGLGMARASTGSTGPEGVVPVTRGEQIGNTAPEPPGPANISDVLYLLGAHRPESTVSAELLEKLGHVGIWFIRGDLAPALSLVKKVVERLDPADPAFDDAAAYLVFMTFMTDPGSDAWKQVAEGRIDLQTGSPRIVSLIIESDRQWHVGSLFKGLLLNQMAMQYAQHGAPMWLLGSQIFLAKKLCDMHVSHQALSLAEDIQRLIDSTGMHAFEPFVTALRAMLHLQAGRSPDALESAGRAVSISHQCQGTVGLKLALSVSAAAHLRRGDRARAIEALDTYDASPTAFVLHDSDVRTVVVRIGLVEAEQGPAAAAAYIRERWDEVGTESGCFVEDPARPAWLIDIARRAGDTELAVRCLWAIEHLARRNPGVPVLDKAVDRARTAFQGRDAPTPPLGLPRYDPLPGLADLPRSQVATGGPAVSPAVPWAPAPREPTGPPWEPPAPSHQPGTEGYDGAPPPDDPDTRADPPAAATGPDLSQLSPRELEVARLVGRGMTNQQVASDLGISAHTVNYHLRGVYRKLNISTRVKLASLMVPPDPGR